VFVGRGVRVGLGGEVGEGVQVGSMRLRGVDVGRMGVSEAVSVGEAVGEGVQAPKIKIRAIEKNMVRVIVDLPSGCGSDLHF
jgi:hypothetical protein